MTNTRFWVGLAAATMVVAAGLALAGIWLATSRPVAVAEAIDGGSIAPLVQALSAALADLLAALGRWL